MSQANKDLIIRAHNEIFNKGNTGYVDEVFSAEYVAMGGTQNGREHIKEMAQGLRSAFPDLRVEVSQIVAEGDLIAWRRDSSGTHTAELAGVMPSGKHISWRTLVISRIENGMIVQESGASNFVEVATAAGD